ALGMPARTRTGAFTSASPCHLLARSSGAARHTHEAARGSPHGNHTHHDVSGTRIAVLSGCHPGP
ncbi:hypothetical protein, partial [Streptomyces glomeratus]|uniref:hypothetical protein n=1 Tax=Streptomyces glomeratus TaxID=284452 RepID=UPI0031D3F0DE